MVLIINNSKYKYFGSINNFNFKVPEVYLKYWTIMTSVLLDIVSHFHRKLYVRAKSINFDSSKEIIQHYSNIE